VFADGLLHLTNRKNLLAILSVVLPPFFFSCLLLLFFCVCHFGLYVSHFSNPSNDAEIFFFLEIEILEDEKIKKGRRKFGEVSGRGYK
jgi:hypothetical protein